MEPVLSTGEGVAFDPMVGLYASLIVQHSTLSDKVAVTQRPAAYNEEVMITELRALTPLRQWSSGEVQVWEFLLAMAGSGSVCLYDLSMRVGKTPLAGLLVDAFATQMGVSIKEREQG